MSETFFSEDEQWMAPAVRELQRLLAELEASWPPSPFARYKFENVLLAAEQGKYAEAYEGILWSRDRFNRWRETAGERPAAGGPSLEDYQARVDAVRLTATAAYAKMDASTPPPLDVQ